MRLLAMLWGGTCAGASGRAVVIDAASVRAAVREDTHCTAQSRFATGSTIVVLITLAPTLGVHRQRTRARALQIQNRLTSVVLLIDRAIVLGCCAGKAANRQRNNEGGLAGLRNAPEAEPALAGRAVVLHRNASNVGVCPIAVDAFAVCCARFTQIHSPNGRRSASVRRRVTGFAGTNALVCHRALYARPSIADTLAGNVRAVGVALALDACPAVAARRCRRIAVTYFEAFDAGVRCRVALVLGASRAVSWGEAFDARVGRFLADRIVSRACATTRRRDAPTFAATTGFPSVRATATVRCACL